MLDIIPILKKEDSERKRVYEKEIGPEFRFQPKTNQERVSDFIQKGGYSQIQGYDPTQKHK